MAKFKRSLKKRLAGAALLLWLMGILFPMAWVSRAYPAWATWFNQVFAPFWVHVVMHAALYAVLAFGLGWFFSPRLSWRGQAAILLLVAVSQEGLQLWGAGRLPGRGEVFDLLVDVGGAVLGWLALRKLNRGQASGINEVKNG